PLLDRLAPLLTFLEGAFHVRDVLLELADPLPHGPCNLRDALGPEKQENEKEDDQHLPHSEISESHNCFPLEERPGDKVRNEYAHETEQGYVKRNRPDRHLQDNQVDTQRANGRCNTRGEKLLRGARGEEPAGELREEAAHDEADGEHYQVETQALARGGRTWLHQRRSIT